RPPRSRRPSSAPRCWAFRRSSSRSSSTTRSGKSWPMNTWSRGHGIIPVSRATEPRPLLRRPPPRPRHDHPRKRLRRAPFVIVTKSTSPDVLRETAITTQSMFRVAAIQMASGPNVAANLEEAGRVIELAAATGARIIALPEYFPIMGMKDTDKVAAREKDGSGPIQGFLSEQAKRHRVWIVGGSVPMEASVPDKVRNSCLVYNHEGLR